MTGVVLGFNDRWDRNYPYADMVRQIGGGVARVFVIPSLARHDHYWRQLGLQVRGLRQADVGINWCLADVISYGGVATKDPAVWAYAAGVLVAKYAAGIVEIGNEPNAAAGFTPLEFAAVFRAAHNAVGARRTCSGGIPTTLGWRNWLEAFVGATYDLDYDVAMHEYAPPKLGTERTLSDLAAFRSLTGREVRVTEIGVSSTQFGEDVQADFLPAAVRALVDAGVKHINIHDLIGYRDGWSMVRDNWSQKPVFGAVQSLMASL